MTPIAKRHLATTVHWVMLVIAFLAIGWGYIRLDANQSDIRAISDRRARDQCMTLKESQKPFVAAVKFFTMPADLTGLTPERLVVVQEVNRQRAEARTNLLANVPDLHCKRL